MENTKNAEAKFAKIERMKKALLQKLDTLDYIIIEVNERGAFTEYDHDEILYNLEEAGSYISAVLAEFKNSVNAAMDI